MAISKRTIVDCHVIQGIPRNDRINENISFSLSRLMVKYSHEIEKGIYMNNDEVEQDKNKTSSRLRYIIPAIVILFLISAALLFAALTQETKPDPASENVIREAAAAQLGKDPNELTDDDFAKITEIDFFHLRKHLGMEFISNSYLPIYGTELSDIKLLEKFTNLKILYLPMIVYPENKIPKWMKFFAKLGVFNLKNRFYIDLSPIKHLHNLNTLYLDHSPVNNIDTLSNLINLKELRLINTKVSNLEPIHNLKNIESLDLVNTPVINLEPIKDLTNLKTLNLTNTHVSNLDPLKGLTNLKMINLSGTQISDLEPLKSLTNLQWIFIENCKNITDDQLEDLQTALPDLKIER